MTILYNCHHDGDQYRITKFVDGNPESSYLTTHSECQCPAGVRPTCRHRDMMMNLLPLVDTCYFWDYDRGIAVDFNGIPKSHYDTALHTPAFETTLIVPLSAPWLSQIIEQPATIIPNTKTFIRRL